MMLSRVADDMYWTARYLERAANVVHLLDISYVLDLDWPASGHSQWEPLVWITGDMTLFQSSRGEATRETVMDFLVLDETYPNSVVSCLAKARENVKGLREQIPQLLWEEINNQWLAIDEFRHKADFSHTRVLQLCRSIHRQHTLVLGMVAESMARGERYHLWQLGTYIERADKTSRILHVKYFHLLPLLSHVGTIVDDMHWSALLRSLHASEDYHRMHGLIVPEKVIDMIVREPFFARSILFCLREAAASLRAMPDLAHEAPLALLDELCSRIERTSTAEVIAIGVHEFINQLQIDINQVNNAIIASIFPPCRTAATIACQEVSQ